ncbi:hypothetical protein NP233_g10065 [Leucocoprinus birnbaumii]|uniref:Uncharacterized protein n=1 Tax=Leucocoprinus birnbaumii TaxID=56174 RepID=A0AAD5VPW8_9AGAR|nr:hypothetical protein NP233_g10065 [Leucocoprinus birnbaumii]
MALLEKGLVKVEDSLCPGEYSLAIKCRYLGDVLILWDTLGVWGVRTIAGLAVCSTCITQLIMQFRIQALYKNKLLTNLLFAIFLGEIVGLAILGLFMVKGLEITAEPLPGIHQCTPIRFPPYSFVFWIPILLIDSLLFALALGVVLRNWRQLRRAELARMGPSLVTILLRDNLGIRTSAFGTCLLTAIVWMTAQTQYFNLPACLTYSITTVLGCRLILNLCDAYHNPSSYMTRGTSEWDTRPKWNHKPKTDHRESPIRFAQNPKLSDGSWKGGLMGTGLEAMTGSTSEIEDVIEMGPISKSLCSES